MKGIVGVDPGWGITAVRVMTGLLFAVSRLPKVRRWNRWRSGLLRENRDPFAGPHGSIYRHPGTRRWHPTHPWARDPCAGVPVRRGDAGDHLVGQDSGPGLECE